MTAAKFSVNAFRFLGLSIVFGAFAFSSCGDKDHTTNGTNIVEKADLIAIYDRGDYDEVFIVNPDGKEVAHYVLLQKEDTTFFNLPEGAEAISVPLSSVILDSEVYAAVLEELNADGIITGMMDASYVTSPDLKNKIQRGSVIDAGQSIAPNVEKILERNPEALILSYYDGMQIQGINKLDIPIIKMYDLQESSPLGRAEWIRLLGKLSGKEKESDSIFNSVKLRYSELLEMNSDNSRKPKVLTETVYEGVWAVPGGKSYQAALIRDAGGEYFKASDNLSVTLKLAPEQVLMEGGDADIWLIKYYGDEDHLKRILESDPIYKEIKAYRDGGVYFSNTTQSGLFREFPFHPDLILKDYRTIFSGDTASELRYFKKLVK